MNEFLVVPFPFPYMLFFPAQCRKRRKKKESRKAMDNMKCKAIKRKKGLAPEEMSM